MNVSRSLFLALVLLVGFSACNETPKGQETKKEKELSIAEQTKKELLTQIEEHEQVIKNATDKVLDAHANQLVNYYVMYADAFAEDSLAPEFLFRAADLSTGLQNFDQAVELYGRVENNYKRYIKHPESIYLAGFIYDTHMDQKGKAKEYYERIIEKYPRHIFAKDAEAAIKALHMTDEELVKMFQEKNKKEEAK